MSREAPGRYLGASDLMLLETALYVATKAHERGEVATQALLEFLHRRNREMILVPVGDAEANIQVAATRLRDASGL